MNDYLDDGAERSGIRIDATHTNNHFQPTYRPQVAMM
jgi:hypothetical protein